MCPKSRASGPGRREAPQIAPDRPSSPLIAPACPRSPQLAPDRPRAPQIAPERFILPQIVPDRPRWPHTAAEGTTVPQVAEYGNAHAGTHATIPPPFADLVLNIIISTVFPYQPVTDTISYPVRPTMPVPRQAGGLPSVRAVYGAQVLRARSFCLYGRSRR